MFEEASATQERSRRVPARRGWIRQGAEPHTGGFWSFSPSKRTETEFVYNGWQVAEEVEGGSVVRSYTYGAYIDEPITMESGANTYYYARNQQYSVTALMDASGDLVESYAYSPYGNMTVATGAGDDGQWFTEDDTTGRASVVGQPYGYTGRRYDAESGLWYFRNRMYSGQMGRFLSADGYGEWEEVNLIKHNIQLPYPQTGTCRSGCTDSTASSFLAYSENIGRNLSKYDDGMNLYENYFVINGFDPSGAITRDDVKDIARYVRDNAISIASKTASTAGEVAKKAGKILKATGLAKCLASIKAAADCPVRRCPSSLDACEMAKCLEDRRSDQDICNNMAKKALADCAGVPSSFTP